MTNLKARITVAWLFVGIPLSYGVIQSIRKASALF